MNCEICLASFDHLLRIPFKLTTCLHHLCLSCFLNSIDTDNECPRCGVFINGKYNKIKDEIKILDKTELLVVKLKNYYFIQLITYIYFQSDQDKEDLANYIDEGLNLIVNFDKAIKIETSKNLLRHTSKVLKALEKYNEAIECLDKIIEIFPVCYDSYENKGLLLNSLQKYDEANLFG